MSPTSLSGEFCLCERNCYDQSLCSKGSNKMLNGEMFSIGPVQQETRVLQVSCYIFFKKTTIYVLDFFFCCWYETLCFKIIFFLQLILCSLHRPEAISVPNLGCYEYFRSLYIFWNKRKPLKFSTCIAEMNSVFFFFKSSGDWPKSLSPFHKNIEKLRAHLSYRKLFREIAMIRKVRKNSDS